LQSSKWSNNSCYIDAALALWEWAQRWLHHFWGEPAPGAPALPVPANHRLANGVVVNWQPLTQFWSTRRRLYLSDVLLDAAALKAAVQQLMELRDAVRRAYEQERSAKLAARSALEAEVSTQMLTMGAAATAFEWLCKSAGTHFLRTAVFKRCTRCGYFVQQGKMQLDPPSILEAVSGMSPAMEIMLAELQAAQGDPFAAFQAKLSAGRSPTNPGQAACLHASSSRIRISSTSAGETGSLIALQLPDSPPDALQYRLCAGDDQVLTTANVTASYRLVGVIMYQKDVHFVTDVRTPCGEGWLRFDGMIANGVGRPTEPPVGRVTHGAGRYFPYLCVYALVPSPPVDVEMTRE